jgi:hypothetical protein
MDSVLEDFRGELLADHDPPCLSIYQPTHRHHPDNLQDKIRFQNLLKELTDSLQQKYSGSDVQHLIDPFIALSNDRQFWRHTLDGLAVLGCSGFFKVYRLQRKVAELAVVADSFHLKPLLRIIQSADSYQILGLSRRDIKLFEGNRDALDEINLSPDVPSTITDALGTELTEPHQTVASYGKGADGPAMRHGHGSRKDELDIDIQRFFRIIDRAILDCHSRQSELPLILAALPEYHGVFRQISVNPFLVAEGIDIHPDALSLEALRDRAWQLVEPHYLFRLASISDEFRNALSKGLGSDELTEVAKAAVDGRVATLLLEADRHIPGQIDILSGEIEFEAMSNPEVDDLLDDLGQLVLKMGGQVIIVPSDRMPADTGLAAIYRY